MPPEHPGLAGRVAQPAWLDWRRRSSEGCVAPRSRRVKRAVAPTPQHEENRQPADRKPARAAGHRPDPSERRAYSTGRVRMPSRRSVPGVLPDSVDSEAMSRMSSESWNATPICSPKRAQHVDDGSVDAGERRRRTAADGGDQRAGLVGEHPQVVLDRVGARPRPDGLADLAGDQPLEGPRLQPDRLRTEVGEQVRTRARTGSRRSGSRPCCPSGRSPTAHRGARAPRP